MKRTQKYGGLKKKSGFFAPLFLFLETVKSVRKQRLHKPGIFFVIAEKHQLVLLYVTHAHFFTVCFYAGFIRRGFLRSNRLILSFQPYFL